MAESFQIPESYIVLVCDTDSGKWSVAANTPFEESADEFINDLKEQNDPTPFIKIVTSDFIQF